jgi:hypothetical protein
MHVFDEEHEKASSPETFDAQVVKFGDPNADTSPQFRAENKALIRAYAVLCTREQREEYKRQLDGNVTSLEVLATTIRVPPFVARDMLSDAVQRLIPHIM